MEKRGVFGEEFFNRVSCLFWGHSPSCWFIQKQTVFVVFNASYYMAELVFPPIRQMTRVDWLLNKPIFYDVRPIVPTHSISFDGKIFELILMKSKEN